VSIPDWSDSFEGEEWEVLVLADKFIPGTVKVEADVPDPRDKTKGRGAKRAKTADDGDHLVEFKVTTTLTTKEEASDFFDNIAPLLRKANKDGSRDPLTIGHPLAYLWNVSAVTIGKISTPSPDSLNGWVISFEMTEWVPAAKVAKPAKPEPQSDSSGVSNPPPTLAERALGNSGLG
jgi:hypothetical protein